MQNPPAFGFGTPAAQQPGQANLFGTTTSGGGLFQAPASSAPTPSLFGTAATANPSFGTTTSTAFGAPSSATPAFGTTASATPTFGATPGAVASAFGTTPVATPAFGAVSSAAPSFGASSIATAFGVAPSSTPAFSATTTTAPAFGATPNVNLGFGTTPAASLSFGATPTATSTFGNNTITAAPTFGATPTTSTGLGGLQLAPGFGATPGAGLSFSSTAPNPAAGFGFGTTTTSAASGVPNTSLSFNLGASLTSTPTTATTSAGLGGQPTTQTKIVTTQKDITPKDQVLPNEILQTVESFKEMVKQQKMHSSEIARCSIRDFRKVEQDIQQMANRLSEVESELQRNMETAEKLKFDTAKCLKDVEIAQRTHETPPGLQYENTAPLIFFHNLADKFEREMQILKAQTEAADNYVKNYRSPKVLTPTELKLGIRQLHESFVALAGRLYYVHNQVESQKEAYLNTRKHFFHDNTNPFDPLDKVVADKLYLMDHSPPKVATGPTPFSNLALGLSQPSGSQQSQSGISYSAPSTSAGGFGNIGFGTSFGSQQSGSQPLFGGASLAQNPNTFQLQKPPTGNKRGKQ